jgi:hypothetical protein
MNLSRRIETLEKQSVGETKLYVIAPKDEESSLEARQRYYQEKNITEADLEAGRVFQIVYVSPGDI